MSSIATAQIYTGFWIDWSRGLVLGSTITLSNRWGAVLTAFLAFFVTVVGACLWRICGYIIHQCSASSEARDGMHHQHQLIFRNTSSPAEATRAFAESAFYWRKNCRRAWSRSLPLALFALMYMLAFAAASLLTSLVTKAAGSQRLIVSDDCGFLGYDEKADLATRTAAQVSRDLNDTIIAATYTRTCYDDGYKTNKLQCNTFVQPDIGWSVDENAECPFDSTMCAAGSRGGQVKSYRLDTGLIDSHHDLGINAPSSGRIGFRKVTTCSVLNQIGYVTVVNSTGADNLGAAGDGIRQYRYGGYIAGGFDANTTYMYNQHAYIDGFGYELSSIVSSADNQAWIPIPELARDDADITLVFLAPNSMKYLVPSNDPFFSANYKVELPEYNGQDLSYYQADEWVNVLGCVDQFQYCSSSEDSSDCTPLTGYSKAFAATSNIDLNDVQSMVAGRIALYSRGMTTYYGIGGRGASALRAQELVSDRTQLSIPNNQWQIEVSSWFAIGLAKLQRNIVEYAAGPDNVPAGTYIQTPTGPISQAMCYSQKVNITASTVSFSVLGVGITVGVGLLIILVHLILEFVVSFVQKHFRWGDHRRLRWVMDDKMQLQRMAFEEAGMGEWENLDGTVPVTKHGQVFGGLEHVDPYHPRLGEKWTQHLRRVSHASVGAAGKEAVSGNSSESDFGAGAERPGSRRESVFVEQIDDSNHMEMQPMTPYDGAEKKATVVAYSKPVYQAITPPGSRGVSEDMSGVENSGTKYCNQTL